MFKHGADYAFDIREDMHNKVGVLESFKAATLRGTELTLNMILCMDLKGKLTKPAYMSRIEGFKPLSEIVYDEESAKAFDKSNRAEFSLVGEFALIADVIIKVDINTRKVNMENSKINFYMPKKCAELEKGGTVKKYLLCNKIVDRPSNIDVEINPQIYQGYVSALVTQLENKIDNRIDLNLLRLA